MSGHSKWSQIRHKKAITDSRKGQAFSKLSRLITLAAKKGTDPRNNIPLAQIIERARAENMPNDNIERAIKKVSEKESSQLEEVSVDVVFEGNIALRVKATTDNKNRTISELKKILAEHEAKMVPPGSIDWMFSQSVKLEEGLKQGNLEKLLEDLDGHDDVQDVSDNLETD